MSFTLQHALDCPKGGLIKRGHNDIRDHNAKLADLAWGGVIVEPVLVPADDRNSRPALQADWSARGVWEGNRVALFDNRIVDANAPSYQRSSWDAIARKAAEAKKRKYARASEDMRSSFTPLANDSLWHPLHTKEGDEISMFWGPCLQSSISRLSFSFLALFFCYAVSSCVYDHNHPYLVSERLFLAENEAFPYPRRALAHLRRALAIL